MSEEPIPQVNEPGARTETGELKDQQIQSTETKTEPKVETKTEPVKAETKAESAPEKYEAFTLPEGYEFADGIAEEVGGIFKKHGLSQAAAQDLVDFYGKKAVEAADAPYNLFEETRNGWRKEILADTSLGNGNALKPEVESAISSMIDSLGEKESKAFREAMELTGAGDHPAVVRGIAKLAEKYGEGTAVNGKGPAATGQAKPGTAPASIATALYPNLPSGS